MQDVVTDGETEAQRLEASGLTHGRAESRGQSSDNNVGLSLLPPQCCARPRRRSVVAQTPFVPSAG